MLQRAGLALLGVALGGCGGGGGGPPPPPMQGSLDTRSITSNINGNTYPLNIYLPPASAGPRSGLPVVYALDGDTWFDILVDIAESSHAHAIIVGIGNSRALRNTDYVPVNLCTPNGGGEVAFLDFIRRELTPYVETTIGGDPARRVLLGHSHGGSFVLYALFAQAPADHHFSAYLSSDASIGCMPSTVSAWDQAYATVYTELPVRLHMSYATGGNIEANVSFIQVLQGRHYARLDMQQQSYPGSHTGIIPAAFADAIAFAIAIA
ncbi:alpha/beta hydrolase [Piscinibacter terrae]|nr:alpha/beta hydrolase-fold protein [Albitalea terrae]